MSQTPNSPTPSSSRPLPRIPVEVDQEEDVEVMEDLEVDRGQSGKKVAKKGRSPNLRLLKKGKLRNMHPDLRGRKFLREMSCSGKNLLKLMIKMLFCAI